MGDRANIFVVDQTVSDTEVRGVYLYTHWRGYELPEYLRSVLNDLVTRRRWNDAPYLTRILIHGLFENDRGGDTGSGVSTTLTPGEYEAIVVDALNGTVSFAPERSVTFPRSWHDTLSFTEYCDQVEAVWPTRP